MTEKETIISLDSSSIRGACIAETEIRGNPPWDEAYDSLKQKKSELWFEYENLLSPVLIEGNLLNFTCPCLLTRLTLLITKLFRFQVLKPSISGILLLVSAFKLIPSSSIRRSAPSILNLKYLPYLHHNPLPWYQKGMDSTSPFPGYPSMEITCYGCPLSICRFLLSRIRHFICQPWQSPIHWVALYSLSFQSTSPLWHLRSTTFSCILCGSPNSI